MKISFDPARHIPVGKDWRSQRNRIMWGFALVIATTFQVLSSYINARRALYEYVNATGKWVLVESRTIVPYLWLVENTALVGLMIFLGAMALMVVHNYLYHRQGSMSIYLMKRLPDRWELHRRCWTVPVTASLAAGALSAAMIGIFYIVYLTCTPAQCLPR